MKVKITGNDWTFAADNGAKEFRLALEWVKGANTEITTKRDHTHMLYT